MNLNEVNEKLSDVFGTPFSDILEFEKIIKKNDYKNLLELGFAHGKSSVFFATILKENSNETDKGHLTTIDLRSAKNRKPNIEELLSAFDLNDYVTVYHERISYNWRLMKLIQENKEPIFDFVYIDGAHDWYNDGFAFFLVDKLLKPGGAIIFDDYNWNYSTSVSLKNTDFVKNMDEDEKTIPQIKLVFDLLVKSHPNYENCHLINNDTAVAYKKSKIQERKLKNLKNLKSDYSFLIESAKRTIFLDLNAVISSLRF